MNNILNCDQYIITNNVPDIELNDVVITFNNGINWHAIPLKLSNSFPIIYAEYHDLKFNSTSILSIVVCPYSCFSAAFNAKLSYKNDVISPDENNMISVVDDGQNINMVTGTINDNKSKRNVKRFEIKMMTLNDMIKLHINIKFIFPTIKKIPKTIVDSTYLNLIPHDYDNRVIHPKTLIYVIEYKSSKIDGYKNTILIGSDVNYDNVSGFDINKNGITKYMNNNDTKIRLKSGFIYPICWFVAKKLFPNANIVKM